jgi:hypothetical protein
VTDHRERLTEAEKGRIHAAIALYRNNRTTFSEVFSTIENILTMRVADRTGPAQALADQWRSGTDVNRLHGRELRRALIRGRDDG